MLAEELQLLLLIRLTSAGLQGEERREEEGEERQREKEQRKEFERRKDGMRRKREQEKRRGGLWFLWITLMQSIYSKSSEWDGTETWPFSRGGQAFNRSLLATLWFISVHPEGRRIYAVMQKTNRPNAQGERCKDLFDQYNPCSVFGGPRLIIILSIYTYKLYGAGCLHC